MNNISAVFANTSIDPKLYSVAVPPLLAACATATAINAFVLISASKIPALKMQPTLLLTLSLAASDTWLTMVVGFGLLFNSYLPIVFDIHFPKHGCFTFFLEAVRLGSIACSVLHLAALAYSQLKSCMSTTCKKSIVAVEKSNERCKSVIAGLWTLPTVCFLLIFCCVEQEGFRDTACTIGPVFRGLTFRVIVVSLLIIPLPVMLTAYIWTFVYIQLRRRSIQGETLVQRLSKTLKTIITMGLILVSFIIGMLPGFLLYLLVCTDCYITMDDIGVNTFFGLSIWVNMMIILKSIMNPFLYATRIPEVRRCFSATARRFSTTSTGFMMMRRQSSVGRRRSRYQVIQQAAASEPLPRGTLVLRETTAFPVLQYETTDESLR